MKSAWKIGWKDGGGWIPAVTVFLVAMAVYANTLWNGFVYDDIQNIVQNPWIKSPRSLPEIFGSHMGGFNPDFATWYYRPLIHIAHMFVYQAAGLIPAAFHLFNIMLHAVNSVLAYLIARELTARVPSASGRQQLPALAIGVLFATHPVHSEAVAWISGVSDLSYTAFALSAFLIYIQGDRDGTTRYWVSGALFLAATLCKEPALALLPLILVYEVAFREGRATSIRASLAAKWLPLVVAAGLYLILRIHALGGIVPSPRSLPHGPLVSILSALDLLARYLYTLVLPVNLIALHVFRPVQSLLDTRALAALAVSGVLTIAAWRLRRHRVATAGLAFVLLPLLPALYIPALGEGVFFERYLYLPVLGFAILLTLGAKEIVERWPRSRTSVGILLTLILLTYAGGTVSRNRVWKDSFSLWSDAARKLPDSAVVQEYLCFAQYGARRFHEALQSCRRALELDDGRTDARANLATVLSVLGDLDGAIGEFQEVLRRRPNSAEALTNLGLVYMAKGRADLAIETYRRALQTNPNYAEAHNNLGVALAMTGRRDEAILELSEAVRLAPDNREYASNLAAARSDAIGPPAAR